MTLSSGEGIAILGVTLAFLVLGFLARRVALALLPLSIGAAFLGATVASDGLYSRIPEDVQATVVVSLWLGSAAELVGVLTRRALDSGRARRTA